MFAARILATGIGAVAISVASFGLAGPGQADEQAGPPRQGPMGPPPPDRLFDMIDADGDGTITKQEFEQHHQERFANGRPGGGPPEARPPRGQRGMGRGPQGRGPRSPEFGPPQGPPQGGPMMGRQGGRRGPRAQFANSEQGPACPHCQGTGQAPRGRGDFGPPRQRPDGEQPGRPPRRFDDDQADRPPRGPRGEGRRRGRPDFDRPPVEEQPPAEQ